MDRNLTYAKTPSGEEATRQRTRVVQRNLRMVLLQVDGQVTVDELIAKIGNEALVINALKELEKGGYVCLAADAPSVWEQSKARIKAPAPKKSKPSDSPISAASALSGASDFSGFEDSTLDDAPAAIQATGGFSTFGKPVLPPLPDAVPAPRRPGIGERVAGVVSQLTASLRSALSRPSRADQEEGADLKPLRKIKLSTVVTSGLALLLLVLGALVFLFPYNSYRPDLEKSLSAAMGVPVRISKVDARFLPRPGLVLSGVGIGNNEAQLTEVFIPQLLSLSGDGRKEIREVVIDRGTLSADFLARLDMLGKQLASDAGGFSLAHITLNQLTIQMGDYRLPAFSGEALFKGGKLEKLALDNSGLTLHLDLLPEPEGAALTVQGYAWKPGGDTGLLVFSSIQAKGQVQAGRLLVRELDANVLNGNVVGNLVLDWSKGFALNGELQLSRLSARQVSTTFQAGLDVDGDLSGTMRYRSVSDQFADLWNAVDAKVAMTLTRGTINGIDLGEAARRGGGAPVRGGATKFERIFGNLRISPEGVSSADIDLDAGLLQARGQFIARRDQTVDANLQVQINSSVTPLRVSTRVNGTLPTLETVAGSK